MKESRALRSVTGLALASLPFALPALAQDRAAPAYDASLGAYASTRDSVRLADGRTIHLVCMGRGSPVVILTPGANEWSVAWNKVQPSVARKTRACAWDRAGFGLSSPSPLPQTADNRTSDLQAALAAGGVGRPYVLVGHSLGGFESLLLKDPEPAKVVGMVLVDIAYPGEFRAAARVAPKFIDWVRTRPSPLVTFMHRCADDLRAGSIGYGKPDPEGCTRPPRPRSFPPELVSALDKAQVEPGPDTLARVYDNQGYYNQSYLSQRDSEIAINPRRNYGSMPLVVLTAGDDLPPPPDIPEAIRPELPLQAAEWRHAQDALAALSTRGVNRVVAGSAHAIHQIKPQVVVDAIDDVVDQARARSR